MILMLHTYVMESKNLIYPSIDIFIFSFIISKNNAPRKTPKTETTFPKKFPCYLITFFVSAAVGWLGTTMVRAQGAGPRRPPNYSQQNMPVTTFSCRDKILGGYYSDPETDCQMFHVCVKVPGQGVREILPIY
ncbi:unnamed protein product [Nesidiocoris tenuis]|uniref:Chitin-binding type-2 domain-containing protein n=1 Tax=Nesidiocoris tenuis TaxID=355587 RepID=A0A6H5GDB9_9HEMI|nr:unnamed protein product [Nesidiocoris tenuis]